MKRIILAASLFISSISFAQDPGRVTSSDPKVQHLLDEAYSHDYFAGKLVTFDILGKIYSIDRRSEPAKVPIDATPPPMKALGELVNGLQVKTHGQVNADVSWEYYPNGVMKDVHIKVSVTGSWDASKEPGAPLPIEAPQPNQ